MNKIMKVAVVCVAVTLCAGTTFARSHRGHNHGRGHVVRHHNHRPVHHHHHHHGSAWGRGGRNFWPGFVGGVVGGIVADAVVSRPVTTVVTTPTIVTTPTVVTTPVVATPVYTTQNVWVEGRYVDQVQPNGTVIRVWQPGHYEQRQVLVQ